MAGVTLPEVTEKAEEVEEEVRKRLALDLELIKASFAFPSSSLSSS